MIDITKEYRTRSGYPVRVLATDMSGSKPVLVLVRPGTQFEQLIQVTVEGRAHRSAERSAFDLIEIPPATSKFFNAYPDATFGGQHLTLREAAFSRSGTKQRIGILQVTVKDGKVVSFQMHPDIQRGAEPRA